ncbi:MAG: transporter substrate-binding domain-containing protein [Erysipelotrichaceae bacterium]|nr:transporter substrate-binding domain-containing protein [Erysipelotrichaceae bacterium]
MKKFLKAGLVLALMVALVGCGSGEKKDKVEQIKEAGKLVLATSPDFPPSEFYYLDDNGNKQIAGSDIALGQAIADKLGVKLEIKATDFNGVLANAQTGQVDLAISGFAATEERKKVMQFSEGYQRETSDGFQGLLVKKSTADKYKTLDELKAAKLKVGAQSASIQYEMAQKITDEKNIKQLGTTDAIVMALNAGDIDAMVVSTSQCEGFLSTFTDLVVLPREEFDLDPDGMYSTNVIGFPLGEEYESLVKVANEVISEARANGDLQKWADEAQELSKKAIEE